VTPAPAEPKEEDADYKTKLKIRYLEPTTFKCLDVCPTGFMVEDTATRANCVEDSNAVILSAIALIFSLFLIF